MRCPNTISDPREHSKTIAYWKATVTRHQLVRTNRMASMEIWVSKLIEGRKNRNISKRTRKTLMLENPVVRANVSCFEKLKV